MADRKCCNPILAQVNKMRPASPQQAQQHMRHLLGRKITGKRGTRVKEHTKRALTIADILYRQFQVGPYQYRLHHLSWYLNICIQPLKQSSQYRHWLTIRLIVIVLGKDEQWLLQLSVLKKNLSGPE